MGARNGIGAKKRDGNCTLQSAEYVLRYGHGTMFAYEPKVKARPSEPVDLVPWWKTFGFDEPRRALPAPQRSAAEELGLSTSSKPTREQVKAAFRQRALAVHPDRGGSSDDFRKAVQARDTLLRVAR